MCPTGALWPGWHQKMHMHLRAARAHRVELSAFRPSRLVSTFAPPVAAWQVDQAAIHPNSYRTDSTCITCDSFASSVTDRAKYSHKSVAAQADAMPPLARKLSSESIGRKAPSRTREDAESITSWGPDGSHELEFDELSAHSGPGSEYALSRPSSEAVLVVPLTRKDVSGLGRQAINKHALRGGAPAEQTTSSLLRGLDLDKYAVTRGAKTRHFSATSRASHV